VRRRRTPERRARAYATLTSELVLQLLHVVYQCVLQSGLRGLPFGGGLLCRRLLSGRAEERRHQSPAMRPPDKRRSSGSSAKTPFAVLGCGRNVGSACGLCGEWKTFLGHDGDPLRVNPMRFLPSSTYPLSMIFRDDVRSFP